jgi:hypothetical protein
LLPMAVSTEQMSGLMRTTTNDVILVELLN